jgi:phage terminase large subunit
MAQIDVELYPQQFKFATSRARMTAFVGGIGSGKTFAGAVRVVYEVAEVGGLGEVIAPTYPMLRDATMRTLRELAQPLIAEENRSEMRWRLTNGAEILFRSADEPERLRGPNLSWVWLDEAALCPAQTWDILIGRLRYTTPDGAARAGRLWITSTPRGRNWLYRKADQMKIFRAATSDNRYLAPEYIAALEEAYTGDFARQELYGEFVAFEGLVYAQFSRDRHIGEIESSGAACIAGLDFGFTNPTAIVVVEQAGEEYRVLDEFYRRRLTTDDLASVCREFLERYHVQEFVCDPSDPAAIEALRRAGIPARPARMRSVMEGIRNIQTLLDQGRLLVSPQCANLAAEFESYCWQESKDMPVKANDHALDALRYAIGASGRSVMFLGG